MSKEGKLMDPKKVEALINNQYLLPPKRSKFSMDWHNSIGVSITNFVSIMSPITKLLSAKFNYLGNLLVKLTRNRTKTHHKILYI